LKIVLAVTMIANRKARIHRAAIASDSGKLSSFAGFSAGSATRTCDAPRLA
jgi:hypothetical protein